MRPTPSYSPDARLLYDSLPSPFQPPVPKAGDARCAIAADHTPALFVPHAALYELAWYPGSRAFQMSHSVPVPETMMSRRASLSLVLWAYGPTTPAGIGTW